MMDEAAVQPPVPVLKWMDVDEAERRRRRLYNSVSAVLAHAIFCRKQRIYEVVEVGRSRADKFGQRAAIMVALAEKHAVGPQADMDEPVVFDQHTLQADHFIHGEFILARLHDGPAPALQPFARRARALHFPAPPAGPPEEESPRPARRGAARAADR